jgi:hypothetical protein
MVVTTINLFLCQYVHDKCNPTNLVVKVIVICKSILFINEVRSKALRSGFVSKQRSSVNAKCVHFDYKASHLKPKTSTSIPEH